MPPRYSYWTIIAGGLPTAFRAADRDDLFPTFKRIQDKHPDAEMKWFARGKLWASPDAARADTEARRRPPAGYRPSGAARPAGERRGRDWRPGGEHRDPRQKFIDAKKERNQDRRRQRFERKQAWTAGSRRDAEGAKAGAPHAKPHGDPLREEVPPSRFPGRARQGSPHKPEWKERSPRRGPQGANAGPKRPPHKRDTRPRGGGGKKR